MTWALEEMASQKNYFLSKVEEDVEELIWGLAKATSQKAQSLAVARDALRSVSPSV